jgi:hypothetical protein
LKLVRPFTAGHGEGPGREQWHGDGGGLGDGERRDGGRKETETDLEEGEEQR